jgi:hypothetical protein
MTEQQLITKVHKAAGKIKSPLLASNYVVVWKCSIYGLLFNKHDTISGIKKEYDRYRDNGYRYTIEGILDMKKMKRIELNDPNRPNVISPKTDINPVRLTDVTTVHPE